MKNKMASPVQSLLNKRGLDMGIFTLIIALYQPIECLVWPVVCQGMIQYPPYVCRATHVLDLIGGRVTAELNEDMGSRPKELGIF